MPQETPYAARIQLPQMLERATTQTAELPVYRGRDLTAPSSGTYTLRRESGTALVDAQDITVTASIATYSVTAAVLVSTLPYSDEYVEEWSLVLGGETHVFRRQAFLVRLRARPTVTQRDLERRHSEIRAWYPSQSSSDADTPGVQDFIDDAWEVVQRRLLKEGRYPQQIASPYAFHDAHMFAALEILFLDAHASLGADGKYLEMADRYRRDLHVEWASIRWSADRNEDGRITQSEEGQSASSVIYTGGGGYGSEQWPWH